MKLFLETTKWESNTPNHSYFLSDDKSKMYAYVPKGKNEVRKIKAFIRFDTRGRTFKEIPNTYNFTIEETTNPNRWEVTGSKGDLYIVTKVENEYTCTCSGFKFRGQCKHIKEVENGKKC